MCWLMAAPLVAAAPSFPLQAAAILAAAFLCMRSGRCSIDPLLVGAVWLLLDVIVLGAPSTPLLVTWLGAPFLFARRP
jgi:hypothetical protein